MKLVKFIEFLRNRLKTVIWVCIGILVVLVFLDKILVDKEHAHTAVERVFGFWSVFGFIGCAILIIVSKWFGHAGIMQKEDYYDE
jgi:hypothetical protein